MKDRIVGIFMIFLVLLNALSVVSAVSLSTMEIPNSNAPAIDLVSEIAETALSRDVAKPWPLNEHGEEAYKTPARSIETRQETTQNPNPTSRNCEDKWNLNDTSEWSRLAYLDGNKTRLIVGINKETPENHLALERIAERQQARIVNTVSIGGVVRAAVVELPLTQVTRFAEQVRRMGLASYIEPNMKVQAQLVPNDPYWESQWGPQKIEADWAWNTTTGSHSVLVAVVDTGIDYTHPDLAANYAPLGYDWVNMDPEPMDDHGHGTHCAGIIGAVLNNSLGVAGLAQVQIMAEKVLTSEGWGMWDWVASGIGHAVDQGANIISMSLGGYGDSDLVREAVKYAYDAGVLVVAAAGNEDTDMKSYPAGYDEVIAVAATDQNDRKAWFSNWGDWIELSAPGVDICSTVPWGYESWSGTSMACPHVSGVAALVWSRYPNAVRDWVKMRLLTTVDDLGDPGFDLNYGYGRVNARKAIEQPLPAHDLVVTGWETPPYVEPEKLAVINATVLNFGASAETDVKVQLLANGTIVASEIVSLLPRETATRVSLDWNPTVQGLCNLTALVVPASGETELQNNALSKLIYVGSPVKTVVLHSAGNIVPSVVANWQMLNDEWYQFGDTMIYIDYATLDKENITYADIAAANADVLLISCAYDSMMGWEFTDSEINAIRKYTLEGHGLIVTSGTFYYDVPNNNKLAPLLGISEATSWIVASTDQLNLRTIHPIFTDIPDPFTFPLAATVTPEDMRWDENELEGGQYLALGQRRESAIVAHRGLVFISPVLEAMPPYYRTHLQLFYNAITWSRYQRPEHELVVSLGAPKYVQPGETAQLNATVYNLGLANETDVDLFLLVDGVAVSVAQIPQLPVDTSYTISYLWAPLVEKTYNVSAYSPPLPTETFVRNNVESVTLRVCFPKLVLWDDTKDTDGDSIGGNYRYLDQLLSANGFIIDELTTGPITSSILANYSILVLMDPELDFSSAEIADIQEWVRAGGSLVIVPDGGYPATLNSLMVPYGVQMTGRGGGFGTTYNVVSHPMTRDVTSIFVSLVWEISVRSPSTWLALASEFGEWLPFLSVTDEYTVVVLSDSNVMDNSGLRMADNKQLMLNIFNLVGVRQEHELRASLESPTFLEPGESALLNATVYNRGLNNETDVQLFLMINDEAVNSTIIPNLLAGNAYTISYYWHRPSVGTYSVTAYARPVPDEENTRNNIVITAVNVRYVTARVAVLNSYDAPPYFIGGWSNNHQLLTDALNTRDLYAQAITNDEITNGVLECFDLFIMIGNVPNEAAVPYVVDFWSAGGGIMAFDSSICFLCYAGLLPPESAGSNGYGSYWDYGTWYQGKIVAEHPITEGYNVGQIISGAIWDAEYWVNALANSSSQLHYAMLVGDLEGSNRAYVSAYEPQTGGRVAHIWDYSHWENTDLRLMILNAISWTSAPHYEHELEVSLVVPEPFELGGTKSLKASIRNRGMKNESDVELRLFVNGSEVDSMMIPQLQSGEWRSCTLAWTPTKTGAYNITVYAPSVSGEAYVANNILTRKTRVFFYSLLYFAHQWIGDGVPKSWHADDWSWEYPLPFDFPFYSASYRTIYVSSNGLITFLGPDDSFSNSIDALAERVAIAPAWEDWTTYGHFDISMWQNATHIGIRWFVGRTGTASVADFEVVLDSTGEIRFDYAYNNGTISATVGISDGKGHILAEDLRNINYKDTLVFVPSRIVRDVAVIDVEPSTNEVLVGSAVNVTAVVANQGDFSESFTTTAYASLQGSSIRTAHAVPLDSTRVFLDPSDYIFNASEVFPSYKFNITVKVENVVNLVGWQFAMYYKDNLINVTRWFEPTWDPAYVFYGKTTTPLPTPPEASYRHEGQNTGLVMVASSLFPPDQTPFEGSGTLCVLEFEILHVPRPKEEVFCDLNIDNDYTYLLDPDVKEIPTTKENGYYALIWETYPPQPPLEVYAIGTTTVAYLSVNASVSLTFVWKTVGVLPGTYRIWVEVTTMFGETAASNNRYFDGAIRVKKSPIARFSYSPEYPKPGVATFFNASASTPEGGIITNYMWGFGDGVSMATANPTIAHTYAVGGVFNVTLTVTDTDDLANSSCQTLYVFNRDLAVTLVAPSTSQTYVGHIVTVSVAVLNQGDLPATSNLTLQCNTTIHEIIGVQQFSNLLPGESLNLTFMWNTSSLSPGRYNLIGLVTPLLGETDLLDNMASVAVQVKMLGDVNGDNKVDLRDYFSVSQAYGETPGRPRWNPNADINDDGKIDLKDLYVVAKNYGKSC